MKGLVIPLACMLAMTGCATHYRCKDIPEGGCHNMSQVYQSTGDGFVDTREAGKSNGKNGAVKGMTLSPSRNGINAVINGEPVLTQAQGMRIWIAPWEDKAGNLNYSFVYIRTRDAQWAILNQK